MFFYATGLNGFYNSQGHRTILSEEIQGTSKNNLILIKAKHAIYNEGL